MKTWELPAIVINLDHDSRGSFADVLLEGYSVYRMRDDMDDLQPGQVIRLRVTDMPQNQNDLVAHVQFREPHVRQRKQWDAVILEYHGHAIVAGDNFIIVQRSKKGSPGSMYDYSSPKMQLALDDFFRRIKV